MGKWQLYIQIIKFSGHLVWENLTYEAMTYVNASLRTAMNSSNHTINNSHCSLHRSNGWMYSSSHHQQFCSTEFAFITGINSNLTKLHYYKSSGFNWKEMRKNWTWWLTLEYCLNLWRENKHKSSLWWISFEYLRSRYIINNVSLISSKIIVLAQYCLFLVFNWSKKVVAII